MTSACRQGLGLLLDQPSLHAMVGVDWGVPGVVVYVLGRQAASWSIAASRPCAPLLCHSRLEVIVVVGRLMRMVVFLFSLASPYVGALCNCWFLALS